MDALDFEMLDRRITLAYRRTNGVYSLETNKQIFHYFFKTYNLITGSYHPMPSLRQIEEIMEKLPFIDIPIEEMPFFDPEEDYADDSYSICVDAGDYPAMIDQYFSTRFAHGCDYRIVHFMQAKIRYYRYLECLDLAEANIIRNNSHIE